MHWPQNTSETLEKHTSNLGSFYWGNEIFVLSKCVYKSSIVYGWVGRRINNFVGRWGSIYFQRSLGYTCEVPGLFLALHWIITPEGAQGTIYDTEDWTTVGCMPGKYSLALEMN